MIAIALAFIIGSLTGNILLYKRHHARYPLGLDTRPTYPVSKPTRMFGRIQYLLYLGVFGDVMYRFLLARKIPRPLPLLIGMAVNTLGLILLRLSLEALGENFAPCNKGALPHERVTTGPYKYVKHPIYLANFLQIAGIAVITGSLMVVAILGIFAWSVLHAIQDEEKAFRERFRT